MGVMVPCPRCGLREYTEFTFGGELRDVESPDVEADFERVYLSDNAPGIQAERWFHTYGCRRWLSLRRDTVTNEIHGLL